MTRPLCSLLLLCGLSLFAADSTIGNLTPITTVPDTYRMPWENPGVVDYYITFANLTNQILSNTLALTGGTVSAPILSTSSSTNAPSGNEFPVASWVRSLFNNGVLDYVTTNIDAVATNPATAGQPVYTYSTTIPLSSVRSYTNPTAGTYIGSVMTTNTFTFLQGPIDVSSYISLSSGGGDAATLHPEIYYSYDKTNWFGDWGSAGQIITPGVTNLYQFVIPFPSITGNPASNGGNFYIERRFKIDSKGGSPIITMQVGTNSISGTNDASHISFTGPSSQLGEAFLANDQTFTGNNTFTKTINGAVYQTNAIIYTNSMLQTINFGTNISYVEGDFQTNANFAWLGFAGISSTLRQTAVVWLTNTSGALITFTAPANCHTLGTLNCTNVTELVFKCPANKWTNVLSVPLW